MNAVSISDSQGNLSQDGIRRITMAVFVNVFPGDVGLRLSEKFFESTDLSVKNIFNGIVGALGKLAQSEALARSGARNSGLAIGEDLAQAVSVFSEIKKTPGMTVDKYLNQSQMFERQLNKLQEKLLTIIDKRSRSGKKVARLLKAYSDVVMDSPPPGQASMMPGVSLSKEQALETADRRSEEVETASMLCPTCLLMAQKKNEAEMHFDPLLSAISCQIGVGCLASGVKNSELPVCSKDQKKDRESCIKQIKATLPAGCNSKTWNKADKPEGCVNPSKVCSASIGCRLGKKT